MLIVIMLSVTILIVIVLIVILLNAIKLIVSMLSVVAPRNDQGTTMGGWIKLAWIKLEMFWVVFMLNTSINTAMYYFRQTEEESNTYCPFKIMKIGLKSQM